ncbi:MAG TPA: tripartite tricarboxylate transporter substrate-binding protein [Xanthobacteraceae bacterium]|jgi:tripartite-type tricarboxylate transporter receptor subunit TctC
MKRVLFAVAAMIAASAGCALAQVFPSRPVTFVVPNPPGGPTDSLARILTEPMRGFLGQPVIVENITGASGVISIRHVVRAAPDGYTLSFGNVASHVFASLISHRDYDVANDLAPIGLLTISPMWIVATNSVPAKDIRELIRWLKANPDKATAGNVGAGSPAHLCGLYFQSHTGTSFAFASYRGAGPIMQDLIAGQINLACLEASASRPYVESGKLKAYAVMAKTRWPGAPNVPTIDEAGVPGLYLPFWHGLWAPKATPPDVIGKLNDATRATLADPAVRSRLIGLGQEIPPPEQQTPEALAAFHRADLAKWEPIIRAANIAPE